MKICYLGNGGSIQVRRWTEYFVKKGHEIHLITFSASEIDGVNTHRLDTSYVESLPFFLRGVIRNKKVRKAGWETVKLESKVTRRGYLSRLAKWRFIPQIRGLIKSIKPDILHAHTLNSYGFLASMANFHPLIATPWGSDVFIEPDRSLFARWQVRHAIKKTDLITGSSDFILRRVNELYKEAKKRQLIEFGIKTDNVVSGKERLEIRNKMCSKLNIPNKAIIIICPRGFEKVYNTEVIVEAAIELSKKNPNVYFIFLRYNDTYSSLKSIVEDSGMAEKVKFLGQIEPDDVLDYYRISDILVSIPSSDGLALSLSEGMLHGCIPVVSMLTVYKERLRNEKNGIFVDINKDSLLNGLLWVIENKDKWEDMKASNLKVVKEKADYSANMDKMEALYKGLVN